MELVALLLAGLLGCSNGSGSADACGGGGAKIDLDKKAEASVTYLGTKAQPLYRFDASGLNGPKGFAFAIRNTASALAGRPLTIRHVVLRETDGAGQAVSAPAFSCVSGGKRCAEASFGSIVPDGYSPRCQPSNPLSRVELIIRFDPKGVTGVRKALLQLRFGGDPAYADKPWDIAFETTLGEPRIACADRSIDFGQVAKGTSATEHFECRSVGTAPVVIEAAELKSLSNPPLKVGLPGWVLSLGDKYEGLPVIAVAPGKALAMSATLTEVPSDEAIKAGLYLTTNDPSHKQVRINLLANTTGPCFKVVPPSWDFDEVPVGGTGRKEVQILGCGTEPAALVELAMDAESHPDFSVDYSKATKDGQAPSEAAPLVVQPGGTAIVNVLCKPTALGEERKGRLRLVGADGTARLMPVSCRPAELKKPIACVDPLVPASTVIPLTTVTMSAHCSKATPGHVVAKYKWKIETQPAGSNVFFVTGDSNKAAKVRPLIASTKGDPYRFTLTVQDELGTASDPVDILLDVLPDNKLHVELTWVTPGDPKPDDDKGADMDLHLAHPLAAKVGMPDYDKDGQPDPWFAKGCDCFWLTCGASGPPKGWGDQAHANDDPHVDIDAQRAPGPENISIKSPEQKLDGQDAWYWVGVHAYNNLTFGPSTPKVRIYLDGNEVFNKKGGALQTGDMWCAGRVRWDGTGQSSDVVPCFLAGKGNEITANYPFKMWSGTDKFQCLPSLF